MRKMVKSEEKMKRVKSSSSETATAAGNCRKKYKGVRMRSWGSWVSEVRAPNQKTRIWLGSYSTPEAAARAYDAALVCLKGSSANLNFPKSADSHCCSQNQTDVMSPKSIQRIAAAAAANNPSPSPSSPPAASYLSPISSSPTDHSDEAFGVLDSSWYSLESLHSPKYMDQMLTGDFFDTLQFDDLYAESNFALWSFC